MSALRGIGAAFEGFTRGVKLADEMETNEQNRKIRLAAEEREAKKFKDEQDVKAQRDFLIGLLPKGDGVRDVDAMGSLEAELADGPKKAAKGVAKPAEQPATQPPAAGVSAPAPAAESPPPAAGIPSPAQTFAYGTNPAPALGLTVEGANAPAPQAPAAAAPQAPDGQPAEPAPRMIPAYGTNKELRDRVLKFNGEIYRRLALLDGKWDLAIKMPEIIEEIKTKEYDRTIGRSAIQARLGDVGSLRTLLEKHGPEVGFEGFKVPVGAAQSKDGSWEVIGPDGSPKKISVDMLDYLAQKSSSPSQIVKFFYDRKDEEIKQGQKNREIDVLSKKADAEIKLGEARLAEAQNVSADRKDAREARINAQALDAAKKSVSGIMSYRPLTADQLNKIVDPKQREAYEAMTFTHGVAQQLVDMTAEPNTPVDRRVAPIAVDIAKTLTAPNNLAVVLTGQESIPDGWKPKPEQAALKKAYDDAIRARANLFSEVKQDDRGYHIVRNGIRIPMPAPAQKQEQPPAPEKPSKRPGVTTPDVPPGVDTSSIPFKAGQVVSKAAGLSTLPSRIALEKVQGGLTDVIENAAEFAYGIRTPQQ